MPSPTALLRDRFRPSQHLAGLLANLQGDRPLSVFASDIGVTRGWLQKVLAGDADAQVNRAPAESIASALNMDLNVLFIPIVREAFRSDETDQQFSFRRMLLDQPLDFFRGLMAFTAHSDVVGVNAWVWASRCPQTTAHPMGYLQTCLRDDIPPGGGYCLFEISVFGDPVFDAVVASSVTLEPFGLAADFGWIHATDSTVWSLELMARRDIKKPRDAGPIQVASWVRAPGEAFAFRCNVPVAVTIVGVGEQRVTEARLKDPSDPLVGFLASGVQVSRTFPWKGD